MKKIIFIFIIYFSLFYSNDTKGGTNSKIKDHCDLIQDSIYQFCICGTIKVPENHSNPSGKKIDISYIIIKTKNSSKKNYPLIYLAGGPGESVINKAMVNTFYNVSLSENIDIIMVDQRGTGFSSALPDMSMDLFFCMARDLNEDEELVATKEIINSYIEKCEVKEIEAKYYNTYQNAMDFGVLMKELGYTKYNLFGVSYGTRLGRLIQSLFPNYLNSVVLDSPSPLGNDFLLHRLESYSRAFSEILKYNKNELIEKEDEKDLIDIYIETINSLRKKPITVELDDFTFVVNSQDAIYLIRRAMYNSNARTNIPNLIKELYCGKTNLLKSVIMDEYNINKFVNTTMLLAVERSDAFIDKKNEIDNFYKNNKFFPVKLGFFDAFYHAGLEWDKIDYSARIENKIGSSVPTLIFVNQFDPVTPPENANVLREGLTNAKVLILNEGGHGAGNMECKIEVISKFIKNPLDEIDTKCLNILN